MYKNKACSANISSIAKKKKEDKEGAGTKGLRTSCSIIKRYKVVDKPSQQQTLNQHWTKEIGKLLHVIHEVYPANNRKCFAHRVRQQTTVMLKVFTR
jgi:hypothetical protein